MGPPKIVGGREGVEGEGNRRYQGVYKVEISFQASDTTAHISRDFNSYALYK